MATALALAGKTCPRCGATYDKDAVFCAKDGAALQPEGGEAAADSDPYIGTVISGDIEIRAVAGVGAMGRVYRAHQRGIDRDVAVKILHRELSGNTHLVQRFHREAKIASKLQHPHVVEVYLAGQLPDNALYIVMEYLDGLSLAGALVQAGGTFPPARALSIALQICDAVGEGHARGIVHRDLKPENVMLILRAEMVDWVKVLDFGIAKVNLGEQSMQTAAGLVFGTARYISPEGAQGTNVAPSGDVYSLATMVYQMLVGRTPFDAEPVGLLIKHIYEPPPPINSWPGAADLHPALAKVVMDNLAKDPNKRAQGARAFAAGLAQAAREANISISEVGVVARLSNVDVSPYTPVQPLDPTLTDAAFASIAPNPGGRPITFISSPHLPEAAAARPTQESGAPAPRAASSTPAEEGARPFAQPAPEEKRRGPLVAIVLLAFLLGVALTVIATQRLTARRDDDRAALVSRARHALSEGKYVSPPGDNVRELLTSGLAKWPDDNDLTQIRTETAHEMVTRSMAARSAGDVGGARNLVREAAAIDPNDHSARLLIGQYQEELDAMSTEQGAHSGAPKVTFETPPVTHPSQRVELVGRVLPGAAGPKAKISGLRITLFANGKTSGGTSVPLTSSDPRNVHATLGVATVGAYDLVFEANVDGNIVRATRDLDVVP